MPTSIHPLLFPPARRPAFSTARSRGPLDPDHRPSTFRTGILVSPPKRSRMRGRVGPVTAEVAGTGDREAVTQCSPLALQ